MIFIIKQIKNYEGYFISDDGKVYSNLGRGNRRTGEVVDMYEVKPRKTKNGYCRVYARNTETGKRKDLYIHRLVAEYFVPNPDGKPNVNHINCDRADNRSSNLEWCTQKENLEYAVSLGRVFRGMDGRYKSGL